jgi:hypothetical protein
VNRRFDYLFELRQRSEKTERLAVRVSAKLVTKLVAAAERACGSFDPDMDLDGKAARAAAKAIRDGLEAPPSPPRCGRLDTSIFVTGTAPATTLNADDRQTTDDLLALLETCGRAGVFVRKVNPD